MADDLTVVRMAGGGETGWVRRRWCVWMAVGLVILGAVLNTIYLFNHSPLDLSEDEASYWLWSEHLDYGYYSKPPGIAWVIWGTLRAGAALGLNGDGSGAALMPVMRMAAVVFGVGSGLLSLFLARRIFRDDRAALGVIVLSAAVPMFAVGSLLITIDSPMYLCWAATVFCLWRAVEGAGGRCRGAKWMYAAGLCAAAGMLFKPVLIALPACVLIAACIDRKGGAMRRAFLSPHALTALIIMLCSQIPVILWNSRHGWVMFKHIGTQGFGGGARKNFAQQFLLDPLSR
ncbi:MAG TPA: glycosyltransferase family 39 protein, partial [Phycisphaerae bacterium]|nr:glycosyltransferase family 39 protein [Phycisphaerae bacterium]